MTLKNLEIIFAVDDMTNENADFYTKNYDMVMASDKESVIAYIGRNIDAYAKLILLNSKITCANEPQERVAQLLKNTQIDIETRKAIIEKCNVNFSNIMEFDTELFTTLFDNNAVESSWLNVQLAFEKNGFDCVSAYLKRINKIDGDFVDLIEVKKETPMAIINEILKILTSTEVKIISATLPAVAPLSGIIATEISDDNLAVFVAAGKVKYSNSDLQMIYAKPKTLCEYLKKYNKDITDNFDTFFAEALSNVTTQQQIIAATINCKGINMSIKRTLIEKCFKIIKITGYERIYADYIIKEKQSVPTTILWQFTTVAGISENDKKAILCQCVDRIDTATELVQYKAYFKTLGDDWNKVYDLKQQLRVEQTTENEVLLTKLKGKNLLKCRKSRMKLFNLFVVEAI